MATYSWSVPTGNIITGSTYIKDTDNKIQDTMDDLADFVNSSGSYTGQGLLFDYVDKANNQTITGVKTFSNGLIGNVTGNVTGTVSGNSGTATKLATARTITLAGDVTGSVSFDGSANVNITTTVGDDSHSHSIAYIAGLQTALDGKLSTSGNAASATYATSAESATNATVATNCTNALGYNQTWKDVTGNRTAGTTYTNSTGKPISISVFTTNYTDSSLSGYVGSVYVAHNAGHSQHGHEAFISFIVPNGSTYRVDVDGTIVKWNELR